MWIGIDPGKSGAIAIMAPNQKPQSIKLDATESDVFDFVASFDLTNAKAIIEKVHSSPQMGVVSAFTFGKSYGFLLGVLTCQRISYQEITPQKWQKAMGCLTKGDKNVTKRKAQQLWPHLKITHANADALLIAEYCRTCAWL